jgi:hypothetical protein
MDDALTARGLLTSITPDNAVLPRLEKVMRNPGYIPVDIMNPSREFLEKTKDALESKEGLSIKETGFSFMMGLHAEHSVEAILRQGKVCPSAYLTVEVGAPLMFSYTVGGDYLKSSVWEDKVTEVNIKMEANPNLPTFYIMMDSGTWLSYNSKKMEWDFNEGDYPYKDEDKAKLTRFFQSPANDKVKLGAFIAFRTGKKELDEYAENIDEGMKYLLPLNEQTLFFKPTTESYFTADSFLTLGDKASEYLLPESVNWDSVSGLSSDEYLEVMISIEAPAFATDNYTGRTSESDVLMEKLIFPGDEDRLAPISESKGKTQFCGMESPAGRVLSSISFDEDTNQVHMVFRDGTDYTFPHPEFQTFKAVDKTTTQELEGKVETITLNKGDSAEEMQKVISSREKRNLDDVTLTSDGKSVVEALAWIGGERRNFLKILTPNGKMITIPLGGDE